VKRFKSLIQFISVTVLMGVIIVVSQFQQKVRPASHIDIRFDEKKETLVDTDSVNKLLIQIVQQYSESLKDGIVLSKAEKGIESMSGVRNAEVFSTISGVLVAEIQQKKVRAKVIGSKPYYIDELGDELPLTSRYEPEVALIRSNEAFEIDGSDVIELLSGIESSELLNKDLKEIKQISSRRFSLLFNSLPFEVIVGEAVNIEQKMTKLIAFLIKAEQEKSLGQYRTVNLSFNNQVVATKK
jgi:cell division protein FtsQ